MLKLENLKKHTQVRGLEDDNGRIVMSKPVGYKAANTFYAVADDFPARFESRWHRSLEPSIPLVQGSSWGLMPFALGWHTCSIP